MTKTLERPPIEFKSTEPAPSDEATENKGTLSDTPRSLRVPFQIAGVALKEGHLFNPTASNPGGPTTFTGMKIDDGIGSSD